MNSNISDAELFREMEAKYGYSRQQIEQLLSYPKMHKYQSEKPLRNWHMVAEVTEAHNCALKTQIGQRLVFIAPGLLETSASDAGLCLWAIAPLLSIDHMVYDRITEGLEPNDMWRDTVPCVGEHPECGGQCWVKFKVKLVKSETTLPPSRFQADGGKKIEPQKPDTETDPIRRLKIIRGMTAQETNTVTKRSKLAKYHSNPQLRETFRQNRIIARVIRCDGCAPGNTLGKYLAFDACGVLLPDESTGIPCIWALAPILRFVHIVIDRLLEGVDPNNMLPNAVWCADSGVDCGGWGHICFRVSVVSKNKLPEKSS